MKTVCAWIIKSIFWMYIGAVAYQLLLNHLKEEDKDDAAQAQDDWING